MEFLHNSIGVHRYWIGITDDDVENIWKDNNDEIIQYTNWRSNEPNGGGREQCGSSTDGKWADYACGGPYHFICENVTLANDDFEIPAHLLQTTASPTPETPPKKETPPSPIPPTTPTYTFIYGAHEGPIHEDTTNDREEFDIEFDLDLYLEQYERERYDV